MIMDIIDIGLLASNMAFWMLGLVRRMAATGTRLRYLCATIQWAVLIPALVSPVLHAIQTESLYSRCISVGNFLVMLLYWHLLRKDDDDNFWRRKRKQLKRYFASIRVRRLQGNGVAVPVASAFGASQPAMGGAR